MIHVKYIGPHKSLRGETALAMRDKSSASYLLVQFDKVSTGLGFGWRALPAHNFQPSRYRHERQTRK